jgi:uncharacterized protein YktA (UPF0223 family)
MHKRILVGKAEEKRLDAPSYEPVVGCGVYKLSDSIKDKFLHKLSDYYGA